MRLYQVKADLRLIMRRRERTINEGEQGEITQLFVVMAEDVGDAEGCVREAIVERAVSVQHRASIEILSVVATLIEKGWVQVR